MSTTCTTTTAITLCALQRQQVTYPLHSLLLPKQPLKPKLTRKIVSSARTNLNKYWSKFEDMLASDNINANNRHSATHLERAAGTHSTRTSFRLMPPMLRNRPYHQRQPYALPASPPASPLDAPATPLDFSTLVAQNNVAEQIQQLMAKRFTVEKNVARSSKYKHFTDESLYHGVNLNGPPAACSCGGDSDSGNDSDGGSTDCAAPKYAFTHRNLSMSFEDKENLENEAMEVYTNLGYETSF